MKRAAKNRGPFPNPLFLEWLMEWCEEAEKKGTKCHFTYVKAIRSLKKYPLVLPTGKDCKILTNFGDKICKMLDDKLANYPGDLGDDQSYDQSILMSTLNHSPRHKKSASRKSKVKTPTQAGGVQTGVRGRAYVPQVRSGPYALLLTLYSNKQKPGNVGYMKKVELMKEAQPLSEKSFKHPDPGSRYTAWSSMGTLLKKGLVEKSSSPARYSISEVGCLLAERLLRADTIVSHDGTSCCADDYSLCAPAEILHVGGGAAARMPDCEASDDLMIDIPLQDRLKRAWNAGVSRPKKRQLKTTTTTTTTPDDDVLRIPNNDRPAGGLGTETTAAVELAGGLQRSSTCHSVPVLQRPSEKPRQKQPLPSSTFTSVRDPMNGGGVMSGGRGEERMSEAEWRASSTWKLPPYSYDIILCVDNQELHGSGSGAGRDSLLAELKKNLIAFDVRKLQVGDFLWVARDKTGTFGSVELVLDYIVERKRMDDLAGSIIDGRFSEQKFRLLGSNISNVIYLIESYGSTQHFSIPEDSLLQAITNTQVVDGFFVKQTGSSKESAAYLTLVTRYLQSSYAGKALLHAESERKTKTRDIGSQPPMLRTFEEFSEASVKTKASTVREMMCKQLLQLAGMTAEKVTAITDTYSTPASLYAAYEGCLTDKQKEEMLLDLKAGVLKRSVGKQLSKAVSMLYCTKGALS